MNDYEWHKVEYDTSGKIISKLPEEHLLLYLILDNRPWQFFTGMIVEGNFFISSQVCRVPIMEGSRVTHWKIVRSEELPEDLDEGVNK